MFPIDSVRTLISFARGGNVSWKDAGKALTNLIDFVLDQLPDTVPQLQAVQVNVLAELEALESAYNSNNMTAFNWITLLPALYDLIRRIMERRRQFLSGTMPTSGIAVTV